MSDEQVALVSDGAAAVVGLVVEGCRLIVRAGRLALDGVTRWTSMVTVELAATERGTRLTHTGQYAFLAYTGDGAQDIAHLKGSTRLQLNGLAAAVAS
jgi:hypothetical protein